ncbi:unnamed protein product, partial [Amoebophrya sp. A25]
WWTELGRTSDGDASCVSVPDATSMRNGMSCGAKEVPSVKVFKVTRAPQLTLEFTDSVSYSMDCLGADFAEQGVLVGKIVRFDEANSLALVRTFCKGESDVDSANEEFIINAAEAQADPSFPSSSGKDFFRFTMSIEGMPITVT